MIQLVPRAEPIAIAGVHASDAAALTLARLLAARPDAARRLSAVSSRGGIVVIGDADALPWVDGATWLGREPDAPELLIPTRMRIIPHATLVLGALRKQRPVLELPLALVPAANTIVVLPLGGARSPGGAPLDAFLAGAR